MSLTATAEKTATAGDNPIPLPQYIWPQLPEQGTMGRRDNDSPASCHQMLFPGLAFGNLVSTPMGWNISGDWRSPPNPTQAMPSIVPSTPMIQVPTQVPLPTKAGMVTFLDQGQYFHVQVPEREDRIVNVTGESKDSDVEEVDPMEALHALEDNIWDPSPLTNLCLKIKMCQVMHSETMGILSLCHMPVEPTSEQHWWIRKWRGKLQTLMPQCLVSMGSLSL
ncbi:hypothetical protein L208DRAFT_1378907 [Tricholoma matsutake]|nr:hypothetical protein L208DRAFT_1378907 [Tricholoma matsutake 945]